ARALSRLAVAAYAAVACDICPVSFSGSADRRLGSSDQVKRERERDSGTRRSAMANNIPHRGKTRFVRQSGRLFPTLEWEKKEMNSGHKSLQDLLDNTPELVDYFYNDTVPLHVYRSGRNPVPPEFTNWRDEQRAWRETALLFHFSYHMPESFI